MCMWGWVMWGLHVQVASIVLSVGFPRALSGWWKSTILVRSHVGPVTLSICLFQISLHSGLRVKTVGTCSGAHAPWRQAVGCGEAVEHADVLRCQELHKLSIVKHFPLAVQDGRRLVRDVNNLPRDEWDGYSKYILPAKRSNNVNKSVSYFNAFTFQDV